MNLLPVDEINSLKTRLTERLRTEDGKIRKPSKKEREDIIDEILDLMLLAYSFGCEDANEMLLTEISPSYEEMKASVYKKVAGENWVERINGYLSNGTIDDIIRVVETDTHRIYNEAVSDTGHEAVNTGQVDGSALRKTWGTMLDDRVRDTHQYLEGTTVPFDAEFYTFDGDHAFAPGGFEFPQNNVNCRCVLTYTIA